jgi:hypothetical protein
MDLLRWARNPWGEWVPTVRTLRQYLEHHEPARGVVRTGSTKSAGPR